MGENFCKTSKEKEQPSTEQIRHCLYFKANNLFDKPGKQYVHYQHSKHLHMLSVANYFQIKAKSHSPKQLNERILTLHNLSNAQSWSQLLCGTQRDKKTVQKMTNWIKQTTGQI